MVDFTGVQERWAKRVLELEAELAAATDQQERERIAATLHAMRFVRDWAISSSSRQGH